MSEKEKKEKKISAPARLREARSELQAATNQLDTAGLTDEELKDAAKAYAKAVKAHDAACAAVSK